VKASNSDGSANDAKSANDNSLLAQLRKRRVFRSAIGYAVVAWGATEILAGVIEGLGWPDWLATMAVILFVTGFPVAMFLSWVFDWTPEGIRRTGPASAMGWLQISAAIMFLMAGSAGLFWLINPGGVAHAETVGVAVMPCRYRGDPQLAYRGDALAEVMNARLAYSEYLFVPDFRSILALSGQNLKTAALGERLDVSWLIECRVSEQEDQFAIDISLVDVSTDESSALTSATFASLTIDESLRNLETATLNQLGIPPMHGPGTRARTGLTSSLDAFDAYLQGLHEMRDGTPEAFRQARAHFKTARTIEDFAMARLGEAGAMMALLESEAPDTASARETTLGAIRLMLEALEGLEPTPAELFAARLRLADISDRLQSQPSATEEERKLWLERATTLRPSFAEPYFRYAGFLERQGRGEEAEDYRTRARQIAPSTVP
jgi:TolB-like protein